MESSTTESSAKKVNKSKLIGAIVGVTVMIIVSAITQKYLFGPPSLDKALIQVANELNKSCPMMGDKDTRLDGALALPDKTLEYNFTLVNMNKADVDTNKFIQYLTPRILNNIKTNPDMKTIKDYNVTFVYSYRDRNGAYLFKITATPNQYN